MYLADLFSVQANVAGLPAISVPCGKDKNGLPIGLQVIADDFEESKLLHFSDSLIKMN
jgi:aspartyl-tRNA(Asn)/glutamyl-tRNA(Gln) amidotransferase subunit A